MPTEPKLVKEQAMIRPEFDDSLGLQSQIQIHPTCPI
jgi:hypothetical protein